MRLPNSLKIDRNHRLQHTACMLAKYFFCMLFSLSVPSAHALTATNNLSVSVVVPPVVQLSVTSMAFGNVVSSLAAQATATITVNMVASQAYNITLDAGLNMAGERRTTDGAGNFRSYLLYKNSAHNQLWGDSDFAATYTAGNSSSSTGTGNDQQFTIYGSSAQSNTSSAGTYSDQVTVTVHY